MINRFTKFLFTALLINGFSVFAQDSLNVQKLSNFKPSSNIEYSDIWGYVDQNNREYALLGGQDGTYIVDVTNPRNPVQSAFIPGPSSIWRDIKVHDHYAYIVTEGSGLGNGMQIVDLSNLPNGATLSATYKSTFSTAHNIFIDNGFAYVIGTSGSGGMHILDLSNPTSPVETAYYTASGYIHDVYAWSDTVVVCAEDNYALVDVTDKSNPVKISQSVFLPGYSHSGWMTEDKKYFFGTDEFNQRDLTIFNLEDKTTWEIAVGSWQYPDNTIIHNLFIKGDYAHISYYEAGYVVLNISDPENPFVVGHYDTYPASSAPSYHGAWGCYPFLPSGNILISDIESGLFVLKFNDADIKPIIDYDTDYFEVFNSDPVEIKAKIMDDNQVVEANLHYRTAKGNNIGDWNVQQGNLSGKFNEVTYTIPGQTHLTTVEYYFAAKDNIDQVTTLPRGGSGTDPLGETPPIEVLSYRVVLAGTPIISELAKTFSDTTVQQGDHIEFYASAIDTTNLEVFYRWTKNGRLASMKQNYTYSSATSFPPARDSIQLTVTNKYKSVTKDYIINVESATSVDDELNKLDFALEQNYPNPFNPVTTITYKIASAANVKLVVYNILGKKVATLVDETKSAGQHVVQFDGSNLPSGTYFYHIYSGENKQTKKMLMLK